MTDIIVGADGLKKADGGKLQYSLLPWKTVRAIKDTAIPLFDLNCSERNYEILEGRYLETFLAKDDYASLVTAAAYSFILRESSFEGAFQFDVLDFSNSLSEVVEVLGHGAKKYGADNWRKGVSVEGITRYKDALLRHRNWWTVEGQDYHDSDSGLPHPAHKNCNYLFLCTLLNPSLDIGW